MNTRLGLTYVKNQFRHSGEAKYLLVNKDGEEDKRKGSLELQSDMKINERAYLLGNANYIDDRYGPYFVDFTLATGMGYQLLRRETVLMEVEAGRAIDTKNLILMKLATMTSYYQRRSTN